MGSQAATTFIENIRINLNEPLASSAELLLSGAGANWLNSDLLKHLNKGKNRLWDIIRRVKEDYFLTTGSSLSITASAKEFSLPSDFRQLRGIKCTTSGYEYTVFRAQNIASADFKTRDAYPVTNAQDYGEMIYDIIGSSKIKFADFPPASLTLAIDYINSLPDFTLSASSTIDINDEQNDWIEAYVTKMALMKTPTDPRIAVWDAEVKALTLAVIDSVSDRQIRDPEFVDAYDPL